MGRKKSEDQPASVEPPQPCWPTWYGHRFYSDDPIEAYLLRWPSGTPIARVSRHRLYDTIWYGEIGQQVIGTRFATSDDAIAAVETKLGIGNCERAPVVPAVPRNRFVPSGVQ